MPVPAKSRSASTKRPVECKKLFANLSEYLDDRLPIASCEHMQRHMEACPACVAFIDDLKRAIDRCRELQGASAAETSGNLRALLTEEYRRLIATRSPDNSLQSL
jgi:RNA polymerase sigma-70 factor (ECF subfamily)